MIRRATLNRTGVRACLAASLVLAACATPPASQRPGPPPAAPPAASASPADIQRLDQLGAQAWQLFRDGQFAQADAVLTNLIAATEFPALPTAKQHAALGLGGAMALEMRDPKRSLTLLRRACDMSEATSLDWSVRLRADRAAEDERDAVAALTILAVRWPDMLRQLEQPGDLDYAMRRLEKLGSDGDRYAVLSALFSVRLGKQHWNESEWWRDLTLLQLDRGQREAAAGTLQRVSDPYVVVSIEADRRFDPIRGLLPGVPAAAAQAVDRALKQARDDPGELEPVVLLAYFLDDALRFAAELQVTDAVIERAEAEGPKAYSDYDREYPYILNHRADALYGLGRWDAAVIQLQAASELPEGRSPNVSQLINLAGMYSELQKPAESRAALTRVRPRAVSPFGAMQAEKETLIAAVQLHDERTVDAALTFMRQHREDAPGALQEALLVSGHEDECARLLISRLTDPHLRSDALVAVQQYDKGMLPAWLIEKRHRWEALVARRDVQAAIERVGRVSRYPLNRPGY